MGVCVYWSGEGSDCVDHSSLFATLQAFGVVEHFLSWVRLLNNGACCGLKLGRDQAGVLLFRPALQRGHQASPLQTEVQAEGSLSVRAGWLSSCGHFNIHWQCQCFWHGPVGRLAVKRLGAGSVWEGLLSHDKPGEEWGSEVQDIYLIFLGALAEEQEDWRFKVPI